jgi:hypothetical protein
MMPFSVTLMHVEDIMLSKISKHMKTNTANTAMFHLNVESEKIELDVMESKMLFIRAGKWRALWKSVRQMSTIVHYCFD